MNPFFESFQKELGRWLAISISGILSALFLASGFSLPEDNQTARMVLLGSSVLTFLVLSSGLLSRYFSYRKFKDYKFNQKAGSYVHKNKVDRICAKCRTNNIFAPLAFDPEKNVFVCQNCGNESLNFPHIIHLNNGAVLVREEN